MDFTIICTSGTHIVETKQNKKSLMGTRLGTIMARLAYAAMVTFLQSLQRKNAAGSIFSSSGAQGLHIIPLTDTPGQFTLRWEKKCFRKNIKSCNKQSKGGYIVVFL